MFTGIIEEVGKVLKVLPGVLQIQAKKVLEGTDVGDSIAVNGVCLTVTRLGRTDFAADIMPETVQRSSLGQLAPGSGVNLERAMAANGRFGGHIVSGHIDGIGKVERIVKDGNAIRYAIAAPWDILRGIVEKGSIAIDGISLTVTLVEKSRFEVSVIPHTMGETTLSGKRVGAVVNLENDVIGKYVERLLSFEKQEEQGAEKKAGLTREFLLRAGF